MASNTKMPPLKEEALENEGADSPLLDLSDAAIKKLIRSAKKRGYVTHGQINKLLSSEEVKSEQIEDILAKLSEIGVNAVETEEAEPEDEGSGEEAHSESSELVAAQQRSVPTKSEAKEPVERTDDPVRMYLREMKLRGHYEKPSERRVREKAEAIRRARKLARKKLQREGLLPMKPRVIPGALGRGGPARTPRF